MNFDFKELLQALNANDTTMNSAPIAIIGGTGVSQFALDGGASETMTVKTPWGQATAQRGSLQNKPVVFMARHGAGHKVAPHKINYQANIAALQMLGVRAVLATTAVGGLRVNLSPGTLVLLDDFIDFTGSRTGKTFFDGGPAHSQSDGGSENNAPVVHTDFTHPYSPPVRAALMEAARRENIALLPTGTYLCCDGPRYESPAEVRLFAQWGADVVGMTGVPEATLAREAGLHYAGVSLVTNAGAGLSPHPLTHAEVEEAMRSATPRLLALLQATIAGLVVDALPSIGPGVPLPGV